MLHDGTGLLPGQSLRLCSAIGQDHRLSSEAAQGHCLGSLAMWGQRLCSTVRQGCCLGFCLSGAVGWAPQLPRFSDQASWPGWTGGYIQQLSQAVDFLPSLGVAVQLPGQHSPLPGVKSGRPAH